jgi:SAM-dependent methyltransferase
MDADGVERFLADYLESRSSKRRVEKVLDAGAGRDLPFRLPAGARVTGVDISEASLAENPSLDARIVGDIETVRLPSDEFDAVLCWNVLEHLPHPTAALENFHSTLRSDSALIVSIPNLLTPKTLVTKFTPHRFHVWVYRRVLGSPTAGLPGHAPFPTYLRLNLLPRRLRRTLEELGFVVDSEIRYSSGMVEAILARNLLLRVAWKLAAALWRVGGVDPELRDVDWVARKRAASTSQKAAA